MIGMSSTLNVAKKSKSIVNRPAITSKESKSSISRRAVLEKSSSISQIFISGTKRKYSTQSAMTVMKKASMPDWGDQPFEKSRVNSGNDKLFKSSKNCVNRIAAVSNARPAKETAKPSVNASLLHCLSPGGKGVIARGLIRSATKSFAHGQFELALAQFREALAMDVQCTSHQINTMMKKCEEQAKARLEISRVEPPKEFDSDDSRDENYVPSPKQISKPFNRIYQGRQSNESAKSFSNHNRLALQDLTNDELPIQNKKPNHEDVTTPTSSVTFTNDESYTAEEIRCQHDWMLKVFNSKGLLAIMKLKGLGKVSAAKIIGKLVSIIVHA